MVSYTKNHPTAQNFWKQVISILTVLTFVVLAQEWTSKNGHFLKFWTGIFILTMLVTLFLVWYKKKQILAFSEKIAREREISRMKLEAEKTAGFALVFAVGLFLQLGVEFDKTSTASGLRNWRVANDEMQMNMSKTFCSMTQNRTAMCPAIRKDVNALVSSLYPEHSESTQEIANRIVHNVLNGLDISPDSNQSEAFEPMLRAIKNMDSSNEGLAIFIKSLPLLSIVFGCIAVSSKIAVARIDFDERDAIVRVAETQQSIRTRQ
jgi:energy-coupling factor transporter transmembrane protein EcfT